MGVHLSEALKAQGSQQSVVFSVYWILLVSLPVVNDDTKRDEVGKGAYLFAEFVGVAIATVFFLLKW
jgi:hypothetical protein